MNRLLSHLFAGTALKQAPTGSRNFNLVPSPQNANILVVHDVNISRDAAPLYSIVLSQSTKPNISLHKGQVDPRTTIGTATFHSFSYSTDMSLYGRSIPLKMNQLTGNFSLRGPPIGGMKWKYDDLTSRSLVMRDNLGNKLAKLKSIGFSGERQLEILVPCDEFLVELMMLSGIAAKMVSKKVNEAAA